MIYKYISKLWIVEEQETLRYVFDFNGKQVYYFSKNNFGTTGRENHYQQLKAYKESPETMQKVSYEKITYDEIEIVNKKYHIRKFLSFIFESYRIGK